MTHEFIPMHISGGVAAACTCNWTSAYTHASERFAREDHDFHVECEVKEAA